MADSPHEKITPQRRRRRPGAPSRRNCEIYERHVLTGETQQQVAAELGISQQRVGQIAARVEGWLATHADHPLAQRMRFRSNRRWDAMWSRAIEGFDRSREDRQVRKERVARPRTSGEAHTPNSAETPLPQGAPAVTLTEITIRQQNGDPRFLSIALRVAEREDRRWQNTGGSGASPLFGVRVAERDDRRRRADPRSRELTELEGRVAGLEGEGNEPSREKSKDDHREPTGETASEALDADAFADEGDELPLAETTAAPEKEEGPAAREATRFGTATRPHLNPLPKGEGTEAPKEKEAPVGDAGASACIGQPRRPPDESEHDDAEPPGPSQTVAGSGGNRQPAGDDDDRRAATPPKKRATSSPRPFFAASSSRATPYD